MADTNRKGEALFVTKGTIRQLTDYDDPAHPTREYVTFAGDYRDNLVEYKELIMKECIASIIVITLIVASCALCLAVEDMYPAVCDQDSHKIEQVIEQVKAKHQAFCEQEQA